MLNFIDKDISFSGFTDKKFRKTEFMELSQGAHVIRILQPQVVTKPTHFFKNTNTSVLCLEADCPICANNKQLIAKFPETFRDEPHYNRVNWRFFVNVLDKTVVKTCECGKEYKNLGLTFCTCGKVLSNPAPLNKVKVLSKGLPLRNDLNSIHNAILDTTGTPVGIMNYDIVLMVSGSGRDTKITPVPRTEANQPVDFGGQELFDLESVVIKLTPEEILDVQRGVRLKDIFAARAASKKEAAVAPVASQEVLDKINAEVNSLFNQE